MQKILKNPYRINILVEKNKYETYKQIENKIGSESFSAWVRDMLDAYLSVWYPILEERLNNEKDIG